MITTNPNEYPFIWDLEDNDVEIIPVTVTGEGVSSEEVDSMISSAIATLDIEMAKTDDLTYTLMVNGNKSGEINIPKDQFLKDVEYDLPTHKLKFTFNTLEGEKSTEIDMSDLASAYSSGEGITISENGIISCNFDINEYVKTEKLEETKSEYDNKITYLEQLINYLLETDNKTIVTDAAELKQILSSGKTAVLTNDITLTSSFDAVSPSTPAKIDLNGNTLKTSSIIRVARGGNITFTNGTIESGNNSYIIGTSTEGGTITLDNINLVSTNTAAAIALQSGNSTLNLVNSKIISDARVINANKNLTNININIDGCEVTVNGNVSVINMSNVGVSGNVAIKNSTIKTSESASATATAVYMNQGSLSIENSNITSNGMGVVVLEKCDTTLKNTNITANLSYALSTNASSAPDTIINIDNCNLTSNVSSSILYNIPGEMNVKDSTVKGAVQSIFARGGDISIENSSLILEATDGNAVGAYLDSDWGSGNASPVSAITIGNRSSSSYQYPTSVSLNKCSVENVGALADSFPTVYAYANTGENLGVTFNYDAETTFAGGQGLWYQSDNIMVNSNEITEAVKYANDGKTVITE